MFNGCVSEPLLQEDGAAPAALGPRRGPGGDLEHGVSQQHQLRPRQWPHHPPPSAELHHARPHRLHAPPAVRRAALLLPQVCARLRGRDPQVPHLLQRGQLRGAPTAWAARGAGGRGHAPGG